MSFYRSFILFLTVFSAGGIRKVLRYHRTAKILCITFPPGMQSAGTSVFPDVGGGFLFILFAKVPAPDVNLFEHVTLYVIILVFPYFRMSWYIFESSYCLLSLNYGVARVGGVDTSVITQSDDAAQNIDDYGFPA